MNYLFKFSIFIGLLFSCKNGEKADINFYYWKTSYDLDSFTKNILTYNHTKKIYLRYFDITIEDGKPIPIGIIQFSDSFITPTDIIPVIYMKNQVFKTTQNDSDLRILVSHTNKLIQELSKANSIRVKEVQFDCDWSLETKLTYFKFLNYYKQIDTTVKLSATIRLHQVKYKEKTGIPPVDKFVLMYYNIGNLNELKENSIFNINSSKKYSPYLSSYPKKLSFALPLFEWGIQLRGDKVVKITNEIDKIQFLNTDYFHFINSNLYEVVQSHFSNGIYYIKGDKLKIERISESDLMTIAKEIKKNYPSNIEECIFYHLDSTLIIKYKKDMFNTFAESLR